MDKFGDRVLVKGITSEIMRYDQQNRLGNNLIFGNIESLTEIQQIQNNQFNFIFSNHTFPYIGNPLNTICDAYEMLAPGGILFLNHIYIHGSNTKTGLSLMNFLCSQHYEIIMGISDEDKRLTRDNCCGPIWIYIKKNRNIKLNLPFYYSGYSAYALRYSDSNHFSNHLMIQYIPHKNFIYFIYVNQNLIDKELKIDSFEQLRLHILILHLAVNS